MLAIERKAEFNHHAQGSIMLARDLIRTMLDWSDYLYENEYTTEQHSAMLEAMRQFYCSAQPIIDTLMDASVEVRR